MGKRVLHVPFRDRHDQSCLWASLSVWRSIKRHSKTLQTNVDVRLASLKNGIAPAQIHDRRGGLALQR